ncbi:hypothetical protein Bca4012_012295 [Brassica carinata]
MASRCRSLSKPAFSAFRSATNKPSLRPKSASSFLGVPPSPGLARPIAQLGSLQSLLPLYSAVASARLTSCLGIDSMNSRSLSQVDKRLTVSYYVRRGDVCCIIEQVFNTEIPPMEKKREGVIEETSLIVSDPFYFLHLWPSSLTFRFAPPQHSTLSHRLFDREIQTFLAFLMLEETWETFVADSLLYAKVTLTDPGFRSKLIVQFSIHVKSADTQYLTPDLSHSCYVDYGLSSGDLVLCHILSKLGTAKKLTPMQLEDLLSDGTTTKYWLIEFYACSSSKCVRSSRCFPDLSITLALYSDNLLFFGTIDLGLFPNTATKFGISLAGGMSQLPTYILFEKGVEVSRFPDFYVDAAPSLPITKKLLCQHFELDRLLLDYINGS